MIPVANKPEIIVKVDNVLKTEEFAPFLHGIEEEGIPYRVERVDIQTVVHTAYEASTQTALSVGAAIGQMEVVVHYKNLPPDQPLFHEQRFQAMRREDKRKLGCNAARLVKGIPFKKRSNTPFSTV